MPYENVTGMKRASRIAGTSLTVALLLTPPAHADARSLSDPLARELKEKGDRAMDGGRYEDALGDYEKAAAIEQHPSLLYNRARAMQGLQRNAEALRYFEAFRDTAPPELLSLVPNLDQLMSAAASQVTTVTITGREGARVIINGSEVGVLPLKAPLRLDSIETRFEFTLRGFEPEIRKVTLVPSGEITLQVALNAKATTGLLRVESPIKQAQVQIDGKVIGFAPSESRLQEGSHQITLIHPDYYDAQVNVVIVPEQTRTLKLDLEKRPAFYQTIWFWTATGVVVTGATATIIALTTERSPDSGDIPPGTVRTFGYRF
jgi:hypothetical protein